MDAEAMVRRSARQAARDDFEDSLIVLCSGLTAKYFISNRPQGHYLILILAGSDDGGRAFSVSIHADALEKLKVLLREPSDGGS